MLVPDEFDGAICTSGFLVIRPKSQDEGKLLWYALRSNLCRHQIYYLAQTASQSELKSKVWADEFLVPMPRGTHRRAAVRESARFHEHLGALLDADAVRLPETD